VFAIYRVILGSLLLEFGTRFMGGA
jgi:hypothetical protein